MIQSTENLQLPIAADDAISLADACKLLPCRAGKPPHLLTVRRWTVTGVKGRAGNRIRLQAFRIGRTWYTRLSWIREFISACTDGISTNGDGQQSGKSDPSQSGDISDARRRNILRGVYGAAARKDLLSVIANAPSPKDCKLMR